MATAADFVTGGLKFIGVVPAETPIEASEMQDGIEVLNDMLSEWEASGILLGFAPIAQSADVLRVPREAHAAIKSNLGIRLGPLFSRSITPDRVAVANDSFNGMLRAIVKIPRVKYPSTLPIGSGNECGDFGVDTRFFPEDTETNF